MKVVPAERLEELFHAVVTVGSPPRTADLTAAAAHSTLDYEIPQRWAAVLWAEGWRAVRHRLRGDVTQQLAPSSVPRGFTREPRLA